MIGVIQIIAHATFVSILGWNCLTKTVASEIYAKGFQIFQPEIDNQMRGVSTVHALPPNKRKNSPNAIIQCYI